MPNLIKICLSFFLSCLFLFYRPNGFTGDPLLGLGKYFQQCDGQCSQVRGINGGRILGSHVYFTCILCTLGIRHYTQDNTDGEAQDDRQIT